MLGAFTLHDYNGTELDKVLKIRNPWAVDSYNFDPKLTYSGLWNDQDPKWDSVSQSDISLAGYTQNINDGIVFISYT